MSFDRFPGEGKLRGVHVIRPLAVLVALATVAPGAGTVIDDFEGPIGWSVNPDGGAATPTQARHDTQHVKSGKTALRLTYRDAPPHWSNLRRAVAVPPNAVAIRLWMRVHAAEANAAMHFWLLEPDRDGWLTRVPPRGKALHEVVGAWRDVTVPISAFRFQPRGQKTRQMTTANTMLLGCNFGDFDVTLDHLRFITSEEPAVSKPPRTENLRFEDGERGRLGILTGLRGSAGSAHPAKLAAMARELGYGATLLQPGDVMDPAALSTRNIDVLVIPCAPAYPREGRKALLEFLKAGGSFVSIGGYAFDDLLVPTPDGWSATDPTLQAKDMDKAQPAVETINTRYGRHGDTMRLQPDQIGAFDPSYTLGHVAYAETAPDQEILKQKIRVDGPLEGFAACAMTGSNSPVFPKAYGRWVPLLNACDSLGRLRGAAASVVHHWDGPFKGSSWALVGVTNRDLITSDPAGEALLSAALRAVTQKTYLHGLKTQWACYRQGEPVQVSTGVVASRKTGRKLAVRFRGDGLEPRQATIPLKARAQAAAVIHENAFDRNVYRVVAELLDGDQVIDRMETAFVVWDDKTVGSGPTIELKENYFRWKGEPRFLCGTNQTGMMWFSEHEDPLVWDRDFAAMAAHGIRVLRVLHFSPFASDDPPRWSKDGVLGLKNRPRKLLRQTDAIVQLAQKHGVAIFLTVHDWMPVELSDAELAAQRDWNRFWADRYRDVPGILYDVQNEPSVQLGRHPAAGSSQWGDPMAIEANRALVATLNRWVKANAEGVKAGDPDALVTVGYLPSQRPADKVLGTAHTDFSNMHYYGPVDRFPAAFKFIDRRFLGKGFSLGEFGAQEAHDARTHGRIGTLPEVSVRRFLATTHYAFGLGASAALNWDWKDFDDCVFPWGLCHPCDLVPKPVLLAFRNTSLFFERLQPRYEDPGLCLLLPDSHRLGGRWNEVHAAIARGLDALIACHVDFNVANEDDLDKLPATCRALVWPAPYCPTDAAFERVLAFVKAGGVLYLSGDVAYDERRQRTRVARLAALGLKDVGAPAPFAKGWREQPAQTQKATVGKGRVFYLTSPIELLGGAVTARYREFLAFAGVKPIAIEPNHAKLHAFTVPLIDGSATIVCNRTGKRQAVRLAAAGVTVGADLTALVATTGRGGVTAVECTGASSAGGSPITTGDAHVMLASLDGEDIRRSRRLAVFPITQGRLAVHTAAAWKSPVLEIGDSNGPTWRTLATWELTLRDGAFTIPIDAAASRSILILREREGKAGLP